jgi:hypothetical protein
MKKIFAFVLLGMLAGCGAQQQRASGIEEETLLVLRAEQMVGTTVVVAPSFRRAITKDDLTPYKFGLLGAADPEEQRLETVTVKVEPGKHQVTVTRDGATVLDKELYFNKGQTRELRIR